jgi:Transposase
LQYQETSRHNHESRVLFRIPAVLSENFMRQGRRYSHISTDLPVNYIIWCADHHDIPEVKSLAETISRWQQPVIDAVLTGYSNARAEAHNRTAKLVARNARGFANPGNQARRVRMATTRTARQVRHRRPRRRSRAVARSP